MELADLRNLDYLVLAIIAISSYLGCKKGFIESFLDFFAWVGSALIVFDNYERIFDFVHLYLPSKFLSGCVASIGAYIFLVIVISLLGVRIIKFASKFVGSPLDKFMGIVFGVGRGVLVSLAIFWSLYMTVYAVNDQKLPGWLTHAQLYKPLKMGSDSLVDAMTSPEERERLLQLIAKKSNKLEDEVNAELKKKDSKLKESLDDDTFME